MRAPRPRPCGRDVASSVVSQPISRCSALDANGDGAVTVDELLVAVNHALGSCS